MAIWNGSSINTNETAMLFNQLATRRSLTPLRKKNGFLYAVLGKKEAGATPGAGQGFQRLTKVGGLKVEWRSQGEQIGTPTFLTKANGIESVTLSHNENMWGGQEVYLAFCALTIPIPHHELDRFAGDDAKTVNYLQEVYDAVELTYENTIGTQLGTRGAGGNPSTSDTNVLGSWPYAIEGIDGTWATDPDSYGSLNRTSPAQDANAFARGLVYPSVGDLTLARIRSAKNDIIINGGDPRFAVAKSTVYGRVEHLVENFTVVNYDSDWSEFGGQHVRYAGMAFSLDNYAPANTLGIMSPASWRIWENNKMPLTKGIVNDPTRKATYVLQTTKYVQCLCLQPNQNAILTGITG